MNPQLDLFGDEKTPERRTKMGQSKVAYKQASSILTVTSGFMKDYDYSINPYSGCSFGCTYCYAAFFSRDKEKMDNWGYWVDVKENALTLLKKKRKKPMIGKTLYMSSVTDPYQPIEKELELVRGILEELLEFHQVRLVIQTRSPMVIRDIDLLRQFKVLQVNMTITTDSEIIRKAFEPLCPSNKVRLKAIQEIKEAGIQSCITLTPLLPVDEPRLFAQSLKATGVERFIIQPFHPSKGKFVRGTRDEALQLLEEHNWDNREYQRILQIMQEELPQLGIGQAGFAPI
ncbi:SPL family radical SAM protein [Phaeodactylibacter xiamenensis]|uniref:SPL family radical SAM protein n=1 Tax=Phaeodactylibacter xiamenensis TaxID=1524460 RepID=UPI0024A8C020|nr:radical SAM protein [Phaeodactylibacter xiamenensis]